MRTQTIIDRSEVIHHMLFMGACVIQSHEEENPAATAEAIWHSTKKRADSIAEREAQAAGAANF